METIATQAGTAQGGSKFVFCSSNHEHVDWVNRALNEWRIKQHALAPVEDLLAGLTACKPQLLLLDFSGNCSGNQENCNATMIALAQKLKVAMPELHLVAVGTMDYTDGAVAALRAGVHHFVDMQDDEEEARNVIRTMILPPDGQDNADPCTLISLIGARIGIGTTTLAVHLADLLQQHKTLQQTEHRIGLLDLGLPAGDGQLYLNATGTFNFSDAIHNRHRLDQTLIQTALSHTASGVRVIPLSRSADEISHINAADAVSLLTQLRPYFDVLIVDLGGFPDTGIIAGIANASDQIWLTTDQSVGSLVSLAALLKELDSHHVDAGKRHLIVNRHDVRYGMSGAQIAERFKLPLKAVLPECALRMLSTANLGKLLHEVARSDPYVRAIQTLGQGLLKSNVDRRNRDKKQQHWLQRYLPKTKNNRGTK